MYFACHKSLCIQIGWNLLVTLMTVCANDENINPSSSEKKINQATKLPLDLTK